MGRRLGRHLYGVAGALFETDRAASTKTHVNAIPMSRTEARDRLFGAGSIAVVAFEAVAAGQAALAS